MPIDYSKWDNIELSDDEDFECHPNVDKKSMVRWKQAQIHKERQERQDQHDLLQLEHKVSAKFIQEFPSRLTNLLEKTESKDAIWKIGDDLKASLDEEYTEPMRKESMKRIEAWPGNWDAPQWGDVLKDHRPWHDEVHKIFEELRDSSENLSLGDIKAKIVEGTQRYVEVLQKRQERLAKQVASLEKEMSKKLTVDQLKTGFDKTSVTKETMAAAPAADQGGEAVAKKPSSKQQVIEVIHDPTPSKDVLDELQGVPLEELEDVVLTQLQSTDEDLLKIHPKLLSFSRLTEFSGLYRALKADPELISEKAEEALMLRGLSLEILTKSKSASTCVFNSQILKFVRELGAKGVDLFFEKLSKSGSTAHNMFYSEVKKMEEHIKNRGKILRKERVEEYKKTLEQAKAHQENLQKQYQKYLQPDGTLRMPLDDSSTEEKKSQAEWFNSLPQYFQEGLLLEDIDKINQYLSSLEPEKAEKEAERAIEAGFIQVQEVEEEEDEQK